jgi:Protein of unknown function (DUF3558)
MQTRFSFTRTIRALGIGAITSAAFALAACGGGSDSPAAPQTDGGSSASPGASGEATRPAGNGGNAANLNPCDLVTQEAAARALGQDVLAGERENGSTRGLQTCTYVSTGNSGAAVVHVQVSSDRVAKPAFEASKEVYRTREDVDGIGDDAFKVTLDAPVVQIHVLKGGVYYTIAITNIDDPTRAEKALAIARDVANKL